MSSVSVGSTPTELNFNGDTPAIPAGMLPVQWQAGSPYPDPNDTSRSVRDTSAYVDASSISTSTHAEPLTDGSSNFIFAAGDIVCVVGVPN